MAYKHHDHEGQDDYKVVSYVDVNELLSFAKKEYRSLDSQIKEEQRVEQELKEFIKEVEKHSDHNIHFIGHEKRYGSHLVRFLFKEGGFMEVILDKPLAMNAHFVNKDQAEKFAMGLRKALDNTLPDHPIKEMIIDDVRIKDGFETDLLTLGKWSQMHQIAIHRTIIGTLFGVFTFFVMKFSAILFEETAAHSIIVAIVLAIVVAVVHEPLEDKVEEIFDSV